MPTSEARINANRKNAARSTGPRTPEGKQKSRANAYKHGMTGDGVVLPDGEAAEVEQRFEAFRDELQPSGVLGLTLLRRAATLAVRMEKCADREIVANAERVGRAMADCVIPPGADEAKATRLRAEAGRLAAFDTSKEATLARRYEASAERGFFRALKEFRLVEKQAKAQRPAGEAEALQEMLGSFSDWKKMDEEFAAEYPELDLPEFETPLDAMMARQFTPPQGRADVPLTIGRAR